MPQPCSRSQLTRHELQQTSCRTDCTKNRWMLVHSTNGRTPECGHLSPNVLQYVARITNYSLPSHSLQLPICSHVSWITSPLLRFVYCASCTKSVSRRTNQHPNRTHRIPDTLYSGFTVYRTHRIPETPYSGHTVYRTHRTPDLPYTGQTVNRKHRIADIPYTGNTVHWTHRISCFSASLT